MALVYDIFRLDHVLIIFALICQYVTHFMKESFENVAIGILSTWLILSLFDSELVVQEFVDAQIDTNSGGTKRNITLIAGEEIVDVAPDNALHPGGIKYEAMVFNGTIPGPVISVDQGDDLQITLKNEGGFVASMGIQAGNGPSEAVGSGAVQPGESVTWSLVADEPGAFFYYGGGDGLNGVWEHVANGMYGGIIVHPINEKPAKEFYVVFSELYNTADKGLFVGTEGNTGSFDLSQIRYKPARSDFDKWNGLQIFICCRFDRET